MPFDMFATLDIPLSLQELGNIMLPVVGTLLGLIYAGLIYWLEGGFSQLEHTRSILEESLVADGKVLLDLLVGATAISLFAVIDSVSLASIGFWIFGFIYFKDVLSAVSKQGYIKAVFGSGRIPIKSNEFIIFLAKLRNAGWQGVIRIIYFLSPTILLPILVNWNNNSTWRLSESSIKICIISVTLFSLIQVRSLLTHAFTVRKQLLPHTGNNNIDIATTLKDDSKEEWSKKAIILEGTHLQELLESLGIYTEYVIPHLINAREWTSRDINDSPVLRWQPRPTKAGHFHMNLLIPYFQEASETRHYIFDWTYEIFSVLADSSTEVSSFAVSFYRKDEYDTHHLALFRDTKSHILIEKEKHNTSKKFIKSIKGGRMIHESIADL